MEKRYLERFPIGNPHRVWKQDKFILSTFSPTCVFYDKSKANPNAYDVARKAVKTCADAGFNLIEMGWATPEVVRAAVPMCEALGLDMIYQNLDICGGMQSLKGADNKCTDKTIHDLVKSLSQYRHVIGFYIWDEPYEDAQISEARRQMDIFQDADPTKLLFSVAIPSYNKLFKWSNGEFPSYLNRYVEKIDPAVLSLDYYPVGMRTQNSECQLDKTLMWCDLALMKKVAKEHNMPMWFYYQGQNLLNAEVFTFPMVRLMMNAGALHGAKGLQHYTAEGAVVTETGDHDIFFEDQKAIHAEYREIGNTLMALDCKRVIHDETLLPDVNYLDGLTNSMEESELLTGKLEYRVSVSESEDEYGNKYLMVLNRDYDVAKTVNLELKNDSRIYEVSKKDGNQYVVSDSTKTLSVELAPGDMALFRVQPASEEAYTIEYVLSK